MAWLAVGIGGALGSLARHAVNQAIRADRFPLGTLVVNLSGCLLIGLLAGLLAARRIALPAYGREFVFAGLLGGFTTFSSFGLDTFTLVRTESPGHAALNVALQVIGGLAAVWLGYRLGLAA